MINIRIGILKLVVMDQEIINRQLFDGININNSPSGVNY